MELLLEVFYRRAGAVDAVLVGEPRDRYRRKVAGESGQQHVLSAFDQQLRHWRRRSLLARTALVLVVTLLAGGLAISGSAILTLSFSAPPIAMSS